MPESIYPVAVAAILLAAGCSSSPPTNNERLFERLIACDLLTAGEYRSDSQPEATSEAEQCFFDCLLEGCDGLLDAICFSRSVTEVDCDERCGGGLHRCGDGTTLDSGGRCNGVPECADGSDEVGCRQFTCDDGGTIPLTDRCDLQADCFDDSDEVGCPAPFVCDGGVEHPESVRCDFLGQCEDGTDEAGCVELNLNCPDT